MSWATDLPFQPNIGVLTGERRERVIKEHIQWLEGRARFQALQPRRDVTPLAEFAATRRKRGNKRTAAPA